ncbi:MAG: hypothetical protein ABF242_10865 [Flavobacteriales bacterium]
MITRLFNIAFVVFAVAMSSASFAQQNQDFDVKPFSKFLIKTNFRIPFTTQNNFLKEVADGVVDMQGSLNYAIIKKFYVGAGYRYAFFKLSDTKLNSDPRAQFDGQIVQQGIYGELSYFYDLYENFSIETNFQIGMENSIGSSAECESKTSSKGVFFAPNLNFYLKTDEVFSFFFSLGYNFSNTNFTPESVCKESFPNFNATDYETNYQHFNVGFGIGISISKPDN